MLLLTSVVVEDLMSEAKAKDLVSEAKDNPPRPRTFVSEAKAKDQGLS